MWNYIKCRKADCKDKKQNSLLRLKKDNKGAAMAMVLIIIMFISILAAVLMFLSYLGYQMRLMDKRGKDTFYTAETVLDEINTGLQEVASEAMAKAYNEVMQNYAVYDSTVMRSSEFYRQYINELKAKLQRSEPDGRYDITLFRSWLSPDVVGNSTVSDVEDRDDGNRASRGYFGTYGAIVESNVTPESYMLVKKESESLLIKDLKVTYVDKSGYVSIISTDIKLVLPTVSFAQSSELPRLEKFSLIADETLAMGNLNAGGSITVQGNAYAGRMTVGRTDDNPSFLSQSYVNFESALGTGVDNMSLVISRENVSVNEGFLDTNNVEFWGENILLSSSDMSFSGITNLKDDLVLEGKSSKAALTGEYNGFSMMTNGSTSGSAGSGGSGAAGGTGGSTEDDSDADAEYDATNPALSSAIIINGQDSSLDLSGLESMTIAGRSYVQTRNITPGSTGDGGTATYQNKNNIAMAESVSLKSNQLIYLVPSEALGCVIENDGSVGDTAYGANPLSLEQYETLINNPDDYVMINGSRQIAALGYKPLSNYINQETVAGQVTKAYVPEVIFKHTSTGTLVYCYLRFADEEKANQYFQDYYNVNSEQIDKYTRLYANEIKMPDPTAMLYLNLSGNMLAYDDAASATSVISAPDGGNSSYYIKQRQAKTISGTKTSAFQALSAKLVSNVSQLTALELTRNAFENIVNQTKLEDMLTANGSNTLKIETGDAGNVKTAILTREPNYVVNASTPQSSIIVSTGNVEVDSSFKGLIIAAGNITVKASAPITVTPLDLTDFSKLLSAQTDIGGTKYYVMDVFRDGVNYQSGLPSSGGTSTETVALKDLIVYEQWIKK
ncbi:MAG: hypothetical protein J1D87_00970 [Lachnospiraceae bacterium]|nr:hypothetical protein [Lachnospiraceae bacterium]